MTDTDLDRLEGQLDGLQRELTALAERAASDVRVGELEYRLEQTLGRLRTVEERLERAEGAPRKARAR